MEARTPESSRREWFVPAVLAASTALALLAARALDTPAGAAPPASAAPPAPAGAQDAPQEIEASHILVMWAGTPAAPQAGVTRSQPEARTRAETALRRVRAGEEFGRLAGEFSDEPGAGARGGSLGRFGRGRMVQAFEDAAFALRPGQTSGLVQSPFGYHIIRRTR